MLGRPVRVEAGEREPRQWRTSAINCASSRSWSTGSSKSSFSKAACFAKGIRSEEHTSELQSHSDLVCRLLLEKKKKNKKIKNQQNTVNHKKHPDRYNTIKT